MTEARTVSEVRAYPKTWGAEFVGTGEVQFKLWAPGEETVTLRLEGTDTPMSHAEDGWFELLATGVAPGARYAYLLSDGLEIPDPASRGQAGNVHGASLVVDPTAYRWRHADWRGRPWEEAVIYELHVGTFTPEGTFHAAAERLEHLAAAGVTAVEIMPVAQFEGERGWGYDGVLLYAPHRAYGSADDMKAFIDAAHGHELMVLLDVVYNHFGPEGNYLPRLAPAFFHPERHTPWGAAIAYEKEPVRRFFIENALYWLEEFHLDGLRLDAIDHIGDEESGTHILADLARRVRAEIIDRPIHLTTEDNRNITRLHERGEDGRVPLYTAEWNDDLHNVAHVVATGETEGYYADFAEGRFGKLARALAEGFAYQGEASIHAGGKPRGHPSGHLPPTAFVDFLQNHDQVGNRAWGERLAVLASPDKVRALTAALLLAPHIPLLFMGEEYGETRPFYFFTDFHGELADAVRRGRRREFEHFAAFEYEGHSLNEIPDPNAATTFEASKLDWLRAESPEGAEWLAWVKGLLELRHRHVVPLLHGAGGGCGRVLEATDGVIAVDWALPGARLQLRANLAEAASVAPEIAGEVILAQPSSADEGLREHGRLDAAAVVVALARDKDMK